MKQVLLGLVERFGWGGRRVGAGRPKKKNGIRHDARPELAKNTPLHLTLRFERDVGNARRKRLFQLIKKSIGDRNEKEGFRLIHFSVQDSHMHLIAEGDNRSAFTRGLRGIQISIALGINKLLGRSGRVFAQRYHEHILKTPREARNALQYVLLNNRRHAAKAGIKLTNTLLDPCASGLAFHGWSTRVQCLINEAPPVAKARSWLLNAGWRKWGLISPAAIPAS